MLQHMRLVGGACFGDDPLTVSNLQAVNFIFGPKGSGKTTISRAFAVLNLWTWNITGVTRFR